MDSTLQKVYFCIFVRSFCEKFANSKHKISNFCILIFNELNYQKVVLDFLPSENKKMCLIKATPSRDWKSRWNPLLFTYFHYMNKQRIFASCYWWFYLWGWCKARIRKYDNFTENRKNGTWQIYDKKSILLFRILLFLIIIRFCRFVVTIVSDFWCVNTVVVSCVADFGWPFHLVETVFKHFF